MESDKKEKLYILLESIGLHQDASHAIMAQIEEWQAIQALAIAKRNASLAASRAKRVIYDRKV